MAKLWICDRFFTLIRRGEAAEGSSGARSEGAGDGCAEDEGADGGTERVFALAGVRW